MTTGFIKAIIDKAFVYYSVTSIERGPAISVLWDTSYEHHPESIPCCCIPHFIGSVSSVFLISVPVSGPYVLQRSVSSHCGIRCNARGRPCYLYRNVTNTTIVARTTIHLVSVVSSYRIVSHTFLFPTRSAGIEICISVKGLHATLVEIGPQC